MFLFHAGNVMRLESQKFIDWQNLKNPIYSHERWSVKDACMAFKDGTFYLFFSAFYYEGEERSHVVSVKTADFKTYSDPLFIWRGESGNWIGMCSPNITKVGDIYYLTYNSWGDKEGQPNQLFYATSRDLEQWDRDKPLATNITKGKRAIDAAIACHDNKYYLIWKEYQTPQVACSNAMGPDGWKRLGKPSGGWFENGEFIRIDEKWHMLVTTDRFWWTRHKPYLAKMKEDGTKDSHWLEWIEFRELKIPQEKFNPKERANAAFLTDWRSYDDYFYLLYAGATKNKFRIDGSDNKLGLARSKDFIKWEIPHGRSLVS